VRQFTVFGGPVGIFAPLAARSANQQGRDDSMIRNTANNRSTIHFATALAAFGLLLTSWTASFASGESAASPEQRRACTPDVYRLCAGEIPNVAAITACLRRKRASLSDACRSVFEQ
jgi:hypothetical protein